MRAHLNGNALYLATSEKFQGLARIAKAVTGETDELPFDLALWAAAELLSETETEGEERHEREGEGREEEEEEGEGEGGRGHQLSPPPRSSRLLLRNPHMLNLGRRVEGSRVEDALYHGSRSISLVHAPRRLRVSAASGTEGRAEAALSAATAAATAAPLPFAPPLVAVVVPRAAEGRNGNETEGGDEAEKRLLSSLVAHAARSLSSAFSVNRGALPVFVALDASGFEAASRAAPYSVLLASDFLQLPPSRASSASSASSSPLRDAAAVAAVAAALSRSGAGSGEERGVLLLSSPAVAAVGAPLDETLLRLQEQGAGKQGGRKKREAPALLLLMPSKGRKRGRRRGGGSGGKSGVGGAAAAASPSLLSPPPLPEMLWAPPSSGKDGKKVSSALQAWSRALAEEAEKGRTRAAAETETAEKTSRRPLSLLAAAASSARVAVARLPVCVFARSPAWDRARKKNKGRGGGGGFGAFSVQLVSFERECRHRKLSHSPSSSAAAAACAREKLLAAGLWRGGGGEMEEEDRGVLSD